MVLFEIYQRFKSHFLNELRVSSNVISVENNVVSLNQNQHHLLNLCEFICRVWSLKTLFRKNTRWISTQVNVKVSSKFTWCNFTSIARSINRFITQVPVISKPVQFLYDKDLRHKSRKSIISYHNQRNSIWELPTWQCSESPSTICDGASLQKC